MDELAEVVEKIMKETGMGREEVMKKIKEKKEELSNLISDEGAAYILAKEYGIDLIKKREYKLKIKNVISGMRNIHIAGRIVRIDPVKEFKTEKGEGKLRSFYIGDETGIIRVVLWNEEVDKIKNFKEGDVVEIKGYVVESLGQPEIRIGDFGEMKPSQEELPSVEEIKTKFPLSRPTRVYEDKEIKDLKEGSSARIRASLVQVFYSSPFFFTCPVCGKSLKSGEVCDEHGQSQTNLVVSGVLDDGTGNIRAVIFRENAEKLLGIKTEDALKEANVNGYEKVLNRIPLGKDFIFKGYVRKNKIFDRLEFIVNEIEDVDVKKEIEKILSEIR